MYKWIDVSYWAVFSEDDPDKILFRGSQTACRRWVKRSGGTVGKVIMEREIVVHKYISPLTKERAKP